ncbi:hypothetical protein DICVIV_12333 [Dictyocaulus viviparus]|uniref:Uncharacterized protein n=1 Tax=Dictyocaulus viviparus TaxID=29172 RepID=A0A0D8XH84_DICVI|nr:hypothetical protein DICVIV_12333 [Dictyocaulus viviparus]
MLPRTQKESYENIDYSLILMTPSVWCRRCDTSDYDFAYTECGADGSRWRVALSYHPGACEGLPEPKKGLNCYRNPSGCRLNKVSCQFLDRNRPLCIRSLNPKILATSLKEIKRNFCKYDVCEYVKMTITFTDILASSDDVGRKCIPLYELVAVVWITGSSAPMLQCT